MPWEKSYGYENSFRIPTYIHTKYNQNTDSNNKTRTYFGAETENQCEIKSKHKPENVQQCINTYKSLEKLKQKTSSSKQINSILTK